MLGWRGHLIQEIKGIGERNNRLCVRGGSMHATFTNIS